METVRQKKDKRGYFARDGRIVMTGTIDAYIHTYSHMYDILPDLQAVKDGPPGLVEAYLGCSIYAMTIGQLKTMEVHVVVWCGVV